MESNTHVEPIDERRRQSTDLGHIVWGLYLAGFFTFAITAVVAVIIAYVKRGDLVGIVGAGGTPCEKDCPDATS